MSASPAKIANYLLDAAEKEGISITPLKLVKLVYIAHGWCLAVLDKDILNGESVQAWQHGPVIPSLYHEFKHYGQRPIKTRATELDFVCPDDDFRNFSVTLITPKLEECDSELVEVLGFLWEVYKQYSAIDLVNITHERGSPWSQHYKSGEKNVVIPNETIKAFYKEQVAKILGRAR